MLASEQGCEHQATLYTQLTRCVQAETQKELAPESSQREMLEFVCHNVKHLGFTEMPLVQP